MAETPPWHMLLSGTHSDYLRVIFSSGLLGFAAYLTFYLMLFFKSWDKEKSGKFVIQGAMAVMLLYSITTTPTIYFPMLYFIFPIFAYATLPQPARQRKMIPQARHQHPAGYRHFAPPPRLVRPAGRYNA